MACTSPCSCLLIISIDCASTLHSYCFHMEFLIILTGLVDVGVIKILCFHYFRQQAWSVEEGRGWIGNGAFRWHSKLGQCKHCLSAIAKLIITPGGHSKKKSQFHIIMKSAVIHLYVKIMERFWAETPQRVSCCVQRVQEDDKHEKTPNRGVFHALRVQEGFEQEKTSKKGVPSCSKGAGRFWARQNTSVRCLVMLVIFLPFNTTRHPGHLVRRVRDGDKHDKTPRKGVLSCSKGAGISLLVCGKGRGRSLFVASTRTEKTRRDIPSSSPLHFTCDK